MDCGARSAAIHEWAREVSVVFGLLAFRRDAWSQRDETFCKGRGERMRDPLLVIPAAQIFSRSPRRSGFTLVELLVVIAIIGILVALLLPAVQAARESARRTQCSNNLKQIGLALHNHLSAHGSFPPAGRGYGMCMGMPVDGEVKNFNGLVSILPYLELQSIYDQFNLAEAISDSNIRSGGTVVGDPGTNGNAALSETILQAFICPSDADDTAILNDTQLGLSDTYYGPAAGFTGAGTNYDFITSSAADFNNCNSYRTSTDIDKRMFGEESKTTPAQVSDGLSNTFMVGETTRRHRSGLGLAWAYRGWTMAGINPYRSEQNAGINLWHMPWVLPSWQSPPFDPVVGQVRAWWLPAASLHPGGCQFVMGDGSVHFVSESIQKSLLNSLSGMADGQIVELP